MKFLIQNSEKVGKQVRTAPANDQRQKEGSHCFYNIMNPSNKIQCDDCKRDISKSTKVLASDTDYCVSCFSNLDDFPAQYHVINKLDYPLFDSEWIAEEQLLLFEALEKHGFGNWAEIADFIGTNKTREDVEEHYTTIYLDTPEFTPIVNVLARRDPQTKLLRVGKQGSMKKANKPMSRPNHTNSAPSFQRGSLTVNQMTSSKSGTNPADIVGFMPKRGDFQVEYDNDAQLLLAEMQFNDDDTEEEKRMKYRLIDIYNQKLNERIRRKEFVISRKLLDLREQMRLDKNRTKEEKEIYNMMKVFARFSSAEEHQRLVQGIIKEKQIRQRLQQLKELKRKGFRTLAEAQDQLQNKKKKEQRSKKKEDPYGLNDKSKTRRMKKDMAVQKSDKRMVFISPQEEELCRRFNINHKQYMMIKETIIRESVKQGVIERDETAKIFKIERNIVDGVFDFLVEKDEIVASIKDDSDE